MFKFCLALLIVFSFSQSSFAQRQNDLNKNIEDLNYFVEKLDESKEGSLEGPKQEAAEKLKAMEEAKKKAEDEEYKREYEERVRKQIEESAMEEDKSIENPGYRYKDKRGAEQFISYDDYQKTLMDMSSQQKLLEDRAKDEMEKANKGK